MTTDKKPTPSEKNNISIGGDVKDSVVISGDNNTVNQTIIQKFFNIFKSDTETLEQRNRRILLNHVENAWIKGVLDASLHGAALLDLGIKQDPEAVTQYPWTLKKESTDETLPAGISMREIFDSIGMGRSLLILGAPGSGKTTMLLELARGLIARAREDVTQPIPIVFNLASWTEKLTLADWLAQELNNLYSVPRKTAPDWVKGNKLLLLLDGLDEVRQKSRAKCVEAINAFRKQHGLTSLAVCSRSQDYADLNAKLSFEGAIEVQPLTQEQIAEFFNRFGEEMSGIKQVLQKDSALREIAETPLFLSIMLVAYRGKRDVETFVSGDEKTQRKHLFDTYIECMFERPRLKIERLKMQDTSYWLSWLAKRMIKYNATPYLIENMQPNWLYKKNLKTYKLSSILSFGLCFGLIFSLVKLFWPWALQMLQTIEQIPWSGVKLSFGLIIELILGLVSGFIGGLIANLTGIFAEIKMVDALVWNWRKGFIAVLMGSLAVVLFFGFQHGLLYGLDAGSQIGPLFGLIFGLIFGLRTKALEKTIYSGQRITSSIRNSFLIFTSIGLIGVLCGGLITRLYLYNWLLGIQVGAIFGLVMGAIGGLIFGSFAVIQHYILRFILARNNLLPWKLVPFLDHCVDLIFLRRVGGGYIFIHRLLMEHFAEMYVETPTSKRNSI